MMYSLCTQTHDCVWCIAAAYTCIYNMVFVCSSLCLNNKYACAYEALAVQSICPVVYKNSRRMYTCTKIIIIKEEKKNQ